MKITVRSDIVLVRPVDPPQESEIIITIANEADPTRYGEVVQCGPGRKHTLTGERMGMEVIAGDSVLYGSHTGEDHFMLLDGESLMVMREADILAVLT